MQQEQRKIEATKATLDIGELEYSVGPSGSSEAVVGLACFAVGGAIIVWRALA